MFNLNGCMYAKRMLYKVTQGECNDLLRRNDQTFNTGMSFELKCTLQLFDSYEYYGPRIFRRRTVHRKKIKN